MTLPSRRIVVLRASRDTVVLTACTLGLTLALAYAVHRRPTQPTPVAAYPGAQVWTGQLADVASELPAAPAAEPMTTASLTVPKSALALPPMQPAAVQRLPKAPACDAQPCPAKVALPMPPARQKLAMAEPARPASVPETKDRRFGLSDLNPLPHLPDVVRKPFNYAGSKISGLIDWF